MIVFLALFHLIFSINDITGSNEPIQQPWYCINESPPGVYQACPFQSQSLTCSYTTGDVNRSVEENGDVPARPSNVVISSYTVKYFEDPQYYQGINISWQLPQDSSYKNVKGFQLVLNYTNAPNTIVRTFNVVLASNVNYVTQWNNIYYYDCIIVFSARQYELTLFSLPVTSLANNPNVVRKTFITAHETNATKVAVGVNNSAEWQASMLVTPNPELNTIQVCFTPAPSEFQFKSFNIMLIKYNSGSLNTLQQDPIEVTPDDSTVQTCVDILNVAPDYYKIWLSADNKNCVCRRPGFDSCNTACVPSEVSPVDMSYAPAIPVKFTTPTHRPASVDDNQRRIGLIVGLVLGSVVIFVIITLIVIIQKLRRQKNFNIPPPQPHKKGDVPIRVPISRKRVLLIYSRDSESHRNVVCRFASFLHKCCECDVSIDEWSNHEIAKISPCAWLTQRLETVSNIIVIHSKGGFRRYRESSLMHNEHTQHKDYTSHPDDPFDDMFVAGLLFLQHDYGTGRWNSKNCFHVYFSQYTSSADVVDVRFGNKYQLMKCMEELYLHLHDLSKFCASGKHVAHGISFEDYASASEEGKQLELALLRAVEYEKNNTSLQDENNAQKVFVNMDLQPDAQSPVVIPPTEDSSISSSRLSTCSDASTGYGRKFFKPVELQHTSFDNDEANCHSVRFLSDDSAFVSGNFNEVDGVLRSSSLRSSNIGSMEGEELRVLPTVDWSGRIWIPPTDNDDDLSVTSNDLRTFEAEFNVDQ